MNERGGKQEGAGEKRGRNGEGGKDGGEEGSRRGEGTCLAQARRKGSAGSRRGSGSSSSDHSQLAVVVVVVVGTGEAAVLSVLPRAPVPTQAHAMLLLWSRLQLHMP